MIDNSQETQSAQPQVEQQPNTSSTPAPTVTEPVGGVTLPATISFEEEFKSRFGKSVEEVEPFIRQPFANQVSKTVDDLLRSGKGLKEIKTYLSVAELDLSAMTDEQIIKAQMRLDNPELSGAHIDALYKREFSIDPEEGDETNSLIVEASRIRRANEAKQKLSELKSKLETPPPIQKVEQDTAYAAWQPVAENVLKSIHELTIGFESDKGSYKLEGFKVDLTPEEQRQVSTMLTNYAVQNRLPATQQSAQQLKEQAERLVKILRYDAIIRAVAEDAYNSGKEYFVRSRGNSELPPKGSNTPPPQPIIERKGGRV